MVTNRTLPEFQAFAEILFEGQSVSRSYLLQVADELKMLYDRGYSAGKLDAETEGFERQLQQQYERWTDANGEGL